MSKIITLTEEESDLIEGLIFDAKRAANKIQAMYLRREVEPRLELRGCAGRLRSTQESGLNPHEWVGKKQLNQKIGDINKWKIKNH